MQHSTSQCTVATRSAMLHLIIYDNAPLLCNAVHRNTTAPRSTWCSHSGAAILKDARHSRILALPSCRMRAPLAHWRCRRIDCAPLSHFVAERIECAPLSHSAAAVLAKSRQKSFLGIPRVYAEGIRRHQTKRTKSKRKLGRTCNRER